MRSPVRAILEVMDWFGPAVLDFRQYKVSDVITVVGPDVAC